jgi:hypothetical protein
VAEEIFAPELRFPDLSCRPCLPTGREVTRLSLLEFLNAVKGSKKIKLQL